MRKILSVLLVAVLCVGLLAACNNKTEENVGGTTVPVETTETTVPEETTTEKPVNILEESGNNGEGDPTDAMDETKPANEDDEPSVDIEVDDDNTGNTGNTGNNGNTGNTGSTTNVYGPLKTGTEYNIRISGKDLYFNGTVANNTLSTGAKTAAVKLQIEKVEGKGIKVFFMKDNVKTYLEIKDGGKCALGTTGSVFTYTNGVYAVTVGAAKYFLAVDSNGTSVTAAAVGNGTAAEFVVASTGETETGNTESGDNEDDFVIDFGDLMP